MKSLCFTCENHVEILSTCGGLKKKAIHTFEMWKMYILILKFCGDLITYVKKVSCVQCNIFVHLCKILRFRRNVDFYISIYWNVKFASSHVNYTHAKILTYKKIMLNWTFSQLTFFLHMWKQNMAHRIPQICLFTCLF